ncbi:MAG TPA: glycosyltransferase family 1 protein [Rhodospirillales bacterium]|jgi:glycosyltransferase involved in cell wall biosynthesis|nr:glycosyltransferase family 1 protein [Rhodospirillales bacterium]
MGNIPTRDGKHASSNTDAPLRIVINGIHAKSGGGVTYLRNILPILATLPNIELHLFLHKDQLNLFYPVSEKVNVTLFSYRPTFFRTLIWEQLAIPIKARAVRSDVLFSPANYGPILARNHVILLRNAVSVIKLTRKPTQILYWLGLSIATMISFLTAKKAIAVSGYAKKLLTFGFPRIMTDKCTVVHHGVNQPKPDQMQNAKLGTDLLAVSDIYIQKNYYTLIQAFAVLIKKRPRLRLIIIGQEIDRAYSNNLKRLIKKLKIEKNISFKGHVNTAELLDHYKNCRVFVFPSLVETFGNPLLEAMSVGVPIACSKEAAMPEVLKDTGVFFDPTDKYDIADKIEQLLSDNELSKKLGKMASQRANTFLWSKTAQQTYDVLNAAAKSKSKMGWLTMT